MRSRLVAGLLLSSFAGCTLSHDTSTPECATACSRDLMHYHGISTVESLCNDMANQRELFLCLAGSCTDDYGPALTYAISTCSHHGATISNLLPVELQHMSLAPQQISPLAPRSDIARFGFESHFILDVDCTAGSDGVLTLSLPESTPSSTSQPTTGGDSPSSPGAGNGDPNVGSSPPAEPNSGPQLGAPAQSGDGQADTSTNAASRGSGDSPSGNDGPQYPGPDPDCDEAGPANGPSKPGSDDQPQPHPAPVPVPAYPPKDDNPLQDGQNGGSPPSPGSGDGKDIGDASSEPGQGNPGQPQPQPVPAPAPPGQNSDSPTPNEGNGVPGQSGPSNPAQEDCENYPPSGPGANTPGNHPTGPSPANPGSLVDCSVFTNNPACINQDQTPNGPPAPAPPALTSSAVPQAPLPKPDPAPNQDDSNCNGEDDASSCPAPNQPPSAKPGSEGNNPAAYTGDSPDAPSANNGNGNTCSDTELSDGCGAPGPSEPQPPSPPQPTPPAIPDECSGEAGNSPCHGVGSDGPGSGSDNSPALPPVNNPTASNTAVPPSNAGSSPPPQGDMNASPNDDTPSCGGALGPCPGDGPTDNGAPPSPANPDTANHPVTSIPSGPPSPPGSPGGQVSVGPEGSPATGSNNNGVSSGQGDLGSQMPENTGAPVQPTSFAPAAPTQPAGSSVQPAEPTTTGNAQEGPHLITPTDGPSMHSSPSQQKAHAAADLARRQESDQDDDNQGVSQPLDQEASVPPNAVSSPSFVRADPPSGLATPEPSFVISSASSRVRMPTRWALTFMSLTFLVASLFMGMV
ncbi:hypothetical protein FSARC_12714 [Fusarium sarcochroum]|uniref:Uncharacterized protein n=1 Tax=Fusarium sarcochroum TaxID=1208366 RepID=A0A8H4WVN8_9HYPO|nr:hypothetical protein FSARC_12714 [Fusarium sarcochroum]